MLQYVAFGVIDAGFLTLATLGFALVSRVHKFLNLAHAELMSVAALLTWALSAVVGLPFALAALVAIGAVALLGLVVGRVVYEPMLSRGPAILLIVSVGVVYLIHGTIEAAVSPGIKSYELPRLADWQLGPVHASPYKVGVLAAAAAAFLGLHLLLTRTSLGVSIRAIANNRELAEIRGIDVARTTRTVWLIASGLAGVAGVALGVLGTLTTDIAFEQILLILSVSILAGLRSIYGVVIAALIVGLAMDVSTLWIPGGYRTAIAFIVIILALAFRPQGLLGGQAKSA